MKETVNITLKIEDIKLFKLKELIESKAELISLKIIPSTEQMYQDDKTFKELVKAVKTASKIRDVYINDNNNKYL